ncbi:MAG: YfhO family protein [Lachnospiraceae bacterium]|nr:YfhO family protein [Lachnospiraceae bacterium]
MFYRIRKNGALCAFLVNLLAGILAFGVFIIADGGLFSVAGDFNVQQIPFAMHANDAIKSGNVVWDWSLDLGSNFIGGMSFYVLGNPSFWLSLLFPSSWFIYLVGWFYVLKYAAAGLTSYLWMSRYVKDERNAIVGSAMYAFSGYMAENLLFYHFHDVAVLFPLLLYTLDLLMEEKKHGPFIGAVTLNLLVNYFFFPGDVLFLASYFIVRYVMKDGRKAWRRFPEVFAEGFLGCMLTMVLMLPSAIFVLQNPRVGFDYVGSNSLVFGAERYLFILKSMIFPGEVMSDHSAVIKKNFASCAAYIPMAELVLVIAFLNLKKKHWLRGMLKWCLVMAVIPILNAIFSLFAGLYYRWYYMPVLMFSLCGAIVIEEIEKQGELWSSPTRAEKAVSRGTVIWSVIVSAFVLFLLFVPWSSGEKSKIYRPDVFFAWTCVAAAGIILTWLILTRLRKYRRVLLLVGVLAFGIGTTSAAIELYHIANGEDAVHLKDRLDTSADFGIETIAYRYTNRDNPETLAHGYSESANFCSTVSGSIFRFYESLGLKRDVKSPEGPEGMMNLISARYTYSTKEKSEGTLIKTVKGKYKTYYIYENTDVPPIGFTYDTYMTFSEFSETADAEKAILMLKTLVVPDEKEDEAAAVLRHYNASVDGAVSTALIPEISRAHLQESAEKIERTTSSYRCEITAAQSRYAFFSIPNDSGWKAYVNGKETEIMDINGFMAVRIDAGVNDIELRYTVPGLTAGMILSLLALAGSIWWVLLHKKRAARAVRL